MSPTRNGRGHNGRRGRAVISGRIPAKRTRRPGTPPIPADLRAGFQFSRSCTAWN